jgi:hypothetical protein
VRQAPPPDLRESALRFLAGLRTADGRCRMTAERAPTLFTDCFAFFVRHLLADPLDAEERGRLVDRLLAAQDEETGWFRASSWRPGLHSAHDAQYVDGQLTTFVLSAVRALGAAPRFPLRPLGGRPSPEAVASHLDRLAWRENPWNSGNRAMQLGILLSAVRLFFDSREATECLQAWFAWHETRARPATGFWGEGHWADGYIGFGGAAHQYVVYHFWNRRPPHLERAVERVLELQYPDGRFWPVRGGGSCYEMDALEVLLLGKQWLEPDPAVEKAARRVLPTVLASRNKDGGFCWAPPGRPQIADLLRSSWSPPEARLKLWSLRAQLNALLIGTPERRTAWTDAPHPATDSSVYDTWFRLLTLAATSRLAPEPWLGRIPWRSLPFPNWGFFAPAGTDGPAGSPAH